MPQPFIIFERDLTRSQLYLLFFLGEPGAASTPAPLILIGDQRPTDAYWCIILAEVSFWCVLGLRCEWTDARGEACFTHWVVFRLLLSGASSGWASCLGMWDRGCTETLWELGISFLSAKKCTLHTHGVSSFMAGDFRTRRRAFQGLFSVPRDLNVIFGAGTVDFVSLRSPFISSQQTLSGAGCEGRLFTWRGSLLKFLEFL